MSEDRISKLAHELVQELLRSKRRSYSDSWNVVRQGDPTGEEVILVIAVGDKASGGALKESIKSVQSVATLPAGTPCPRCGGTGRV